MSGGMGGGSAAEEEVAVPTAGSPPPEAPAPGAGIAAGEAFFRRRFWSCWLEVHLGR